MRHDLAAALVAFALMAPLSPGRAQLENPGCAAGRATLPPELAAWPARRPVAAGDGAGVATAALEVGVAVDASLRSTREIRYVARPEKPGGSVSYGGLFGFAVDKPGTYRVALGSGAWIDVLKGRRPIASTAHGRGPDCSDIRKMVDFPLTPGRYTLQIAANGAPLLPLAIVRLP